MSYQVFTPFLELRQFDDSGKLLANGKMFFLVAGGTLTQFGNVYADSTGTPAPNPVILNGAGTANIYGDPVAYKIVIQDSTGAQIFEIDNVFPFGAGSGGAGLGTVAVVLNYAGLRALSQDYDAVIVCGRTLAGDGGGGLFFRSTSAAGDNDGTILVRATTTRYLRNFSGMIDPVWFGVIYSTAADQTTALDAAAAVGTVQVAGQVYQGVDHHYTGKYYFLPGSGLYTGGGLTPKTYFDTGSKILQGAAGMFGAGLQVTLGQYVTEAIRSSWFNTFEQAEASSTWNYSFLVDANPTVAADIAIPANFAVDFVGGAQIPVVGAVRNLSIKNLVYQGTGQIISYDTLAHVGTVDLAGVPALLEWFGGQAGYTFGINNAVPGKAVVNSGSIRLLSGQSYVIPADGTTWTTGKALTVAGVTGAEVLQINQNVTWQALTHTDCIISGAGTLTSTGIANLKDCGILGIQSRTSANSSDAAAAIFVPASLLAMGNGGAAESSSDGIAWSTISGISETVAGPIAQGPIRIVAGLGGKIWKSLDGGQTWASQAVTGFQWWGAYYLQGKYILVGSSQIAYSTDGSTWNTQAITGSANVLALAWHSPTSLWVATGGLSAGGPGVWTSPDLVTWTNRPLPSGISTSAQLLTVVSGPGGILIASGNLSGSVLESSNATTWTQLLLPGSDTIYASAASADTVVLAGSTGAVYVSATNGATWSKLSIGSVAIQAAIWNAGVFFLGGQSGNTWISTTNAKTWIAGNVGNSNNILAVALTSPVYAVSGVAGSLQISTDTGAAAWSSVTIPGLSTDITNMRSIGGLVYITAKGGKLFSTVDFQAFRSITTGTTNDLYDIVYNSTAVSWTVVGASGYIATSSNLTTAAPTWTTNTAPTSSTIIRAVWDGARYTFATASNIYQTIAVGTTATTPGAVSGIVYDGTNWVQFGAGGLILSSPDKVTWTVRVAPANVNILCGFADSTAICLGTASGALFRSTDHGATWASVSVSANTIRSIAWNAGTSRLGLCTDNAKVWQSADHGATWSDISGTGLTAAANLLSIWARGSEWDVCGAGGQWAYTTSTTWTQRSTGVSVQLNAGLGDNVVGAAGTTLNCTSGIVNSTANWGIAADLVAINQNTVLDSTGKAWNTDAAFHFMVATDLLDPLVTGLSFDGTVLWAIGNDAWTSTTALGFAHWTKVFAHPAGINDLALIGGVLYLVGNAGYYASSPNGAMWSWQGALYDASNHYSVAYYRYGELSLGIQGVRAFAQGTSAVVIAGVAGSISSGAGALLPVFSALQVNATNVTATVDLGSTNPGTIQGSDLRSVSNVGTVSDSSFSNFHGTLNGNVVRGIISAIQTIQVNGSSILIDQSSLSKTDALDSTRAPLFAFAGTRLQMDGTSIEPNGSLLYSESTSTAIYLNECQNSSNFAFGLSNGFAKVYVANCGMGLNSTAYSINGQTLDNSITLAASAGITGATTNWFGLPAGTTSDGTSLTLGAAMVLGNDPSSTATLRYAGTAAALGLLEQLGGRIKLDIIYPTGYTPDPKCQPVAKLVRPKFAGISSMQTLGRATGNGIAQTVGKVTSYSNVWGGLAKPLVPIGDGVHAYNVIDSWGDVTDAILGSLIGAAAAYTTHSARIVVLNAGIGAIPSGTKITITLMPQLPIGFGSYSAFFDPADNSIDYLSYLERQALTFANATANLVSMERTTNAASAVTTDISFLSLSASVQVGGQTNYLKDYFVFGAGVFVYPTDQSILWPVFTNTQKRIDAKILGLSASSILSLAFGQNTYWSNEQERTPLVMLKNRPDKITSDLGVFAMEYRMIVTHPEGTTY